jgi:hypothetical protein
LSHSTSLCVLDIFETGSVKLFSQADFEPRSSWSLPHEWLGLQAWANWCRISILMSTVPFRLIKSRSSMVMPYHSEFLTAIWSRDLSSFLPCVCPGRTFWEHPTLGRYQVYWRESSSRLVNGTSLPQPPLLHTLWSSLSGPFLLKWPTGIQPWD